MSRFISGGAIVMAAVTGAVIGLPAVAAQAEYGPQPGQRTETVVDSLAPASRVVESEVKLYSPLPSSVGVHPPACDYISYLRYRDKDGPRDSSAADEVLTAQPGVIGGATSYDQRARQVVEKAAERGKHVEFWAISRRSNCLVDHTGLDAAVTAKNYHVAVDYYYNHKTIDGKQFAGFPSGQAVHFLKDFDQPQMIDDWYQIMRDGLPDPQVRARKLFCGGHSFGGLITGLFGGWDFDGNPKTTDDAGYKQCAGFFADDTLVTTDPAGLAKLPGAGDLVGAFAGFANQFTDAAVQSGLAPADTDLGVVITPETFNMLSIVGIAAYFQPDQETDLLKILPHNLNLDTSFKVFLSRTYGQFLSNYPNVRSFRYTNEALLGALLDNNSQPVAGFQLGLGSFGGGPVATKDFPLPNQITNIPGIGKLLSNLIGPGGTKVGPTDPSALYTWRDYKQTPDTRQDGSAYTSKDKEVTDIHQLARTLFEGPATFTEPYFPLMLLPNNTFLANNRWGKFKNVMYPEGVISTPRLTIFGGDGLVTDALHAVDPIASVLNPSVPLIPKDTVVLPGYRHIDVPAAAPEQNNGKPEGGSTAMTDFVLGNSRLGE